MIDPEFLTLDDVLWIQERQLELYGGQQGIRDRALLEAAVGMPQQTFAGAFLHRDLFGMAAAYAFHIAQNQPFLDGNKRTALEACLVFLDINGVVVVDPEGKLFDAMIEFSQKTLSKDGMAALLRDLPRE